MASSMLEIETILSDRYLKPQYGSNSGEMVNVGNYFFFSKIYVRLLETFVSHNRESKDFFLEIYSPGRGSSTVPFIICTNLLFEELTLLL